MINQTVDAEQRWMYLIQVPKIDCSNPIEA